MTITGDEWPGLRFIRGRAPSESRGYERGRRVNPSPLFRFRGCIVIRVDKGVGTDHRSTFRFGGELRRPPSRPVLCGDVQPTSSDRSTGKPTVTVRSGEANDVSFVLGKVYHRHPDRSSNLFIVLWGGGM